MVKDMGEHTDKCEICGLEVPLTKHHLIPVSQSRHKNKYLKNDESNFLWICEECHSQIHALFTNQELKDLYNTKELLLSNPKFKKYVEWRIKHPDFNGTSKMSNSRKRKR